MERRERGFMVLGIAHLFFLVPGSWGLDDRNEARILVPVIVA